MIYILQVDFPIDGPFGQEMSRQFADLAKSINGEPGFYGKFGQKMLMKKKRVAFMHLIVTKMLKLFKHA